MLMTNFNFSRMIVKKNIIYNTRQGNCCHTVETAGNQNLRPQA